MKRACLTTLFAILSAVLFIFTNIGQTTELSSTNVYGFGSMAYDPDHGNGYSLRRARLGLEAYAHSEMLSADSLMLNVQCDVNAWKLIIYYGQVDHEWKGGVASLLFGYHMMPVQYLYDGPAGLRLTRWPDALNEFSGVSPGLALWYKNGPFNLKVSNFGADTRNGATIGFGALSLGWEEYVGVTGTFQGTYLSKRFVNLFLGATHYSEQDLGNVFFVQNHWKLSKSLRLYGQYDFGADSEEAWLTGFNWEFGHKCFINLYYDTQEDGSVEVEAKFAVY